MEHFLDRHQLSTIKQDQINYLNRPINPKEIETVINEHYTEAEPNSALRIHIKLRHDSSSKCRRI
jgi:hypothetical protein